MRVRSTFFKKQFDLAKAELIGQGNFAQVYRVYDNTLNDSLAIRRVRKSESDLEDIQKEKQINEELRKVDNENILKIYDIIDQPDAVWYITEYCSGGSLWDALNLCKDNKMNQRDGLQCVLQISKGVQELHNHRITHRDLKPENILLKTKYVPGKTLPLIKLADFGLSTQKIIMETIAGTKQYIAPEQAKFHNYTNAVDVWSLGIIFDEILHGTPFYSGEDNKQVFNKILKMPFKVRDERLRNSIKQLLINLLKKKPYQRPIIAVIRSTVEKILEQIDEQSNNKLEAPMEKGKKSKSSNNSSTVNENLPNSYGFDSINLSNLSPKDNLAAQRRANDTQREKKERELENPLTEDRSDKTYFKKETAANSRVRPSKQEDRNIIVPLPREQPQKPGNHNSAQKLQKLPKQKLFRPLTAYSDYKPIHQIKETSKSREPRQPKEIRQPDSAKQLKISKIQYASKSPIPNLPLPLPQKINIYKLERKRLIPNTPKKEEIKYDLIDLPAYIARIHSTKRTLQEQQLKLEKQHVFLPNTYLSNADIQAKCPPTNNLLPQFRKKMDFLNYCAANDDYQIKLLRGEAQLRTARLACEQQLLSAREIVREIFFSQLQLFIDQFLQKVIK